MGFGRVSNFKHKESARDVHKVTEVTTATYSLTQEENGHILSIKMVVLTTFTGTWKIASAADGDLMFGAYQVVSIAAAQEADVFAADGTGNDNIVIDADNKGRQAGSWFEFFLMGENEWVVRGETYCTATPTTGWSDS